MANKQTALEYFYQKLIDSGIYLMSEELEFYEQAKQMEKEQIMDANSCGFSDGINHEKDIPVNFISCEQYYNETFKSE